MISAQLHLVVPDHDYFQPSFLYVSSSKCMAVFYDHCFFAYVLLP